MAKDLHYDDFWLNYLRAHSAALTRKLHYVGTALGISARASTNADHHPTVRDAADP
jgi:hypothetical protein